MGFVHLNEQLPHFSSETTLRTHPAVSLLQHGQDVLSGASFHNEFERLSKLFFWAPACSEVMELLLNRAQGRELLF
jgi:hypothetical protein